MSLEFIHRPIDRWPQEPTRNPKPAPFRVSYSKTLELLRYELARIGAKRVYLQLDVTEREIRNDGQIRAGAQPRSQRVIVAADTKVGPVMLPCDTYNDWQANLRAIALSLQALRAVNRYGVTKRGEQYRGLKALPAGDGPVNAEESAAFISKHCGHPALVGEKLKQSDIILFSDAFENCYRAAAKALHPDVAGESSRGDWDKLQRAAAILRDYHREHHGA